LLPIFALMTKQKSIDEKFDALFYRIDQLEKEVDDLKDENKHLKECLVKYENPKNSSNSNMSPSSDFPKQTKTNSLRTSSGKKHGVN
jgi:cell shape-determining protein MreC